MPGTRAPLWIQILSFSCSFGEIFDQIIGWRPRLGGWRPLLWEILDPPLWLKCDVMYLLPEKKTVNAEIVIMIQPFDNFLFFLFSGSVWIND